LDPELTPESAIEILAIIKTCTEKKKSIEELTARIKDVNKFIRDYETKVSLVLEDCGKKREGISIISELEKITEELAITIKNKRELEQLEIDENNLTVEVKALEEENERLQIKISGLFSEGFAKSEDEFRENAKNWTERNKLVGEIDQAEQNIKRISGGGTPYSDFISELNNTSPEILKERKSQIEERYTKIEKSLSELRENRGGIIKEIEQIERREEASSLRLKRSTEERKLNKKSEEWSVLTLARTIMGKAVEKYEKERQPGVLKEAQSFFSQMTLMRYSSIYAPLDEAKIYVEDKKGRRKEIKDLSRGTAEQLYLSLRFGFIREFTKRAESLPIVFDDIFVNFDPERFRAACEAIKELANTHQILYFTCHPETVDLLTKIIPDSRKVDISIPRFQRINNHRLFSNKLCHYFQ